MRLVLVVLVVILALTTGGLLVLPMLVDGEAVRSRIAAQLEALTGHPVAIDGRVDLRLLPRPHLSVARARIAAPAEARAAALMEVDRLDLQVAILPLLLGELEVREARLVRPIMHLERLPDGRLSWTPADAAAPALPVRAVRLSRMRVVDGSLRLDAVLGEGSIVVAAPDVELAADSLLGPYRLEGALGVNGRPLAVRLDLGSIDQRGMAALRLTVDVDDAAHGPTQLGYRGLVRLAGPESHLRGDLTLASADAGRAAALVAELVESPLEALPDWLGGHVQLRAQLELDRARLGLEELEVNVAETALSGHARIAFGAPPRIDLRLAADRLVLAEPRLALEELRDLAVLAWHGRVALSAANLPLRGDIVRRLQLSAELDGEGGLSIERAAAILPGSTDVSFAGRLGSADSGARLEGELRAASDDLRRLLLWLGLDPGPVPEDRLRTLHLSAELVAGPGRLSLHRGDVRIDASQLQGSLALAFGARMRLALAASLNRLNLDAYLPAGAAVDLEGLRALAADLDAAVDLALERLSWRGLLLENLRLRGELDQEVVLIQELSVGDVAEASGNIVGSLDLARQGFDVALSLGSERPARVLRALGYEPPPALVRFAPVRVTATARGGPEGADVELELQAAEARASIDGQLTGALSAPHYALDFRLEQATMAGFLRQLGALGLREDDLEGPLRIDGHVRGSRGQPATLRIGALLGPMRGDGVVTLQAGGPRPRVGLRLVADPLDMFVAQALGQALLPHVDAPAVLREDWLGHWPRDPIDLGWLSALDLELELGAREVRLEGGRLPGLALDLRLEDRVLRLGHLLLDLGPGELRLTGSVDGQDAVPALRLSLELGDIDAARLLALARLPEVITGTTELRADLHTAGRSAFDLVGGLRGEVDLRVREGQILGIDLAALARTIEDGPDQAFARVSDAVGRGVTRFALLGGPFEVERGVLRSDELALVLDDGHGRIAGSLDLVSWIADLTLALAIPPGREERLGLQLIGPFDRLHLRPLVDQGLVHPVDPERELMPLPPG